MNILLLFPKHRQDYYSPTNLVMLGTITEKLGHTVKIVDLNYDKLPKEKFDIVGVTGQSSWKNQIIEVANSFPNSTVIVGGSWASLYPEEALSHKNIKHVCVGEGERVWSEFLHLYPNVEEIEGLGSKNKINPQTSRVMNLETYPSPDWSLLKNVSRYKSVSIYGSRGCCYNCCFCSDKTIWGHEWRARSAESVVSEIEDLVKVFKVKNIVFNDENMTLNPERVADICIGVISRKIKVSLNCVQGVRVDKLPFELLDLMKQAGFKQISFSPESGCERVLKEVIHKNLDLKFVEPVVKHATEIGLHTMAKFVVGFPWETKAEVEETLRFAEKLRSLGCESYVGNVIPFPDTELYAKAKAEGYLRFDSKTRDRIASDMSQPRKVHLLNSPHWKTEWIIQVCADQWRKDMQAVMKRTPKSRLIKHTVRHPITMLKKLRNSLN